MAVVTKEQLMERVKSKFGEDTSDETIQFLEDLTDTIDDLETKANGDGIDWKAKYEENDKQWKTKYTERFYKGGAEDKPKEGDESDEDDDKPAPKTFDELFETK